MIRVNIKPVTVNRVWQGKRYKTPLYSHYERDVALLLPNTIDIPKNKKLRLKLKYGLSSKNADIDNPAKPILDILQKKYDFNDKWIYKLDLEKEDVKKGDEYFEFKLEEL